MRLGLPFTGIDGPGTAARAAGWPLEFNNVVETSTALCRYLSAVLGRKITRRDIMEMAPASHEDCDILFFGPPCQPHTTIGLQGGDQDARIAPFWKAIDMAAELKSRTPTSLKAVIIEWSPAILHVRESCRFMDIVDELWKQRMMPAFLPLEIWRIKGTDVNVPMPRERVFLISTARIFKHVLDVRGGDDWEASDRLPFAQPSALPFTRKPLDFLEEHHPPFNPRRDFFGDKMRAKYKAYRQTIQNSDSTSWQVAVCDLSRKPDGVKGNVNYDMFPSFCTNDHYLAVFSVDPACAHKVTNAGRYLALSERANVSGFDYKLLNEHLSTSKLVHAIGNCILVPVAEHVLGATLEYLNQALDRDRAIPLSLSVAGSTSRRQNGRKRYATQMVGEEAANVCVVCGWTRSGSPEAGNPEVFTASCTTHNHLCIYGATPIPGEQALL